MPLHGSTDLFDSASYSPGNLFHFLRCMTGVAENFSQPECHEVTGIRVYAVGIIRHSDLEDKLYLYRGVKGEHIYADRSPGMPSRFAPDFTDEIRCCV